MISVVVPTMWKFAPFPDFLLKLMDHPQVYECLLINNDHLSTPNHLIFNHPKLKVIHSGKNLYVNPSWNMGIYHASQNLVCIMNDDIIFDLSLLDMIISDFNPHQGSCGIQTTNSITGGLKIEPYTIHNVFGFGQLMFVWQKNWIDIPSDLLVYYGDNWIFDTNFQKFGTNMIITNLLHYTPHASTAKNFGYFLDQEHIIYLTETAKLGIDRIHN